MKRYPYNHSHRVSNINKIGHLGCVGKFDTVPGDTISGKVSGKVRFNQFKKPFVHDIVADVWMVYFPYRLLWDNWTNFITENQSSWTDLPTNQTSDLPLLFQHQNAAGDRRFSNFAEEAYKLCYNLYFARDEVLNDSPALTSISATDKLWGTAVPPKTNGLYSRLQKETEADRNVITNDPDRIADEDDPSQVPLKDGADADSALDHIDIKDLEDQIPIYKEMRRRATYGDEYEDIMSRLGTKLKRDTPERPEVWARKRIRIPVSDALAGGDTSYNGYAVGTWSMNVPRRYAPEHGIVLTLMSYRPDVHLNQSNNQWLDNSEGYSNIASSQVGNYWMPHHETARTMPVNAGQLNQNSNGTTDLGYIKQYDWYRYPVNLTGYSPDDTTINQDGWFLPDISRNETTGELSAFDYDTLFTNNKITSAGHAIQRCDWQLNMQRPVTPIALLENRTL